MTHGVNLNEWSDAEKVFENNVEEFLRSPELVLRKERSISVDVREDIKNKMHRKIEIGRLTDNSHEKDEVEMKIF